MLPDPVVDPVTLDNVIEPEDEDPVAEPELLDPEAVAEHELPTPTAEPARHSRLEATPAVAEETREPAAEPMAEVMPLSWAVARVEDKVRVKRVEARMVAEVVVVVGGGGSGEWFGLVVGMV